MTMECECLLKMVYSLRPLRMSCHDESSLLRLHLAASKKLKPQGCVLR